MFRVFLDFRSLLDAVGPTAADVIHLDEVSHSASYSHSGKVDEFASAFRSRWASDGLPPGRASGIEWTLHLDGEALTGQVLAASPFLTDYFFIGGRLLVDRFFSGEGCDLYVTSERPRASLNSKTEVLGPVVGVTLTWSDVFSRISELRERQPHSGDEPRH